MWVLPYMIMSIFNKNSIDLILITMKATYDSRTTAYGRSKTHLKLHSSWIKQYLLPKI